MSNIEELDLLKILGRDKASQKEVTEMMVKFAKVVRELLDSVRSDLTESQSVSDKNHKTLKETLKGVEKTVLELRKNSVYDRLFNDLSFEVTQLREDLQLLQDREPEKIEVINEVERTDLSPISKKIDDTIARFENQIDLLRKEVANNKGTKVIGGQNGLHLYINSLKKGLIKFLDIKAGDNVTLTHSKVNGLDTLTIAATGGAGSGDMEAATYDPQNIASDAFDTDNHTDGTTNKVYTATEKTKLAGIEASADVTDAGNVGAVNAAATSKATPVNADSFPIVDSEASNVIKRLTFTNLKAFLKTYLDTLYAPVLGSDDNYVTDAEKVVIGNTSGTNTGDQDLSTYQLKPSEGAFANGDKTKLDGIEALADVTDTTNVTAAGALMDSELTDIAAVKALLDADAAAVNTGTSTTAFVTPDALAGSNLGTKNISVQVIDGATALATGDGKAYIRVPAELNGMNIVGVAAQVIVKSTSGTPTVQIARGRQASATDDFTYADTLSTLITIDANEYDSKDATAAAAINTSNDDLATGDVLRVDVDVAGTGTKGLQVTISCRLP